MTKNPLHYSYILIRGRVANLSSQIKYFFRCWDWAEIVGMECVAKMTKVAQQKGSDPLLWAFQMYSNLNSAGESLPSLELAEFLVSYICWDNNVPILWKFLEKALTLQIVPPMLLLALLSVRSFFLSTFSVLCSWSSFFFLFFSLIYSYAKPSSFHVWFYRHNYFCYCFYELSSAFFSLRFLLGKSISVAEWGVRFWWIFSTHLSLQHLIGLGVLRNNYDSVNGCNYESPVSINALVQLLLYERTFDLLNAT